MQTEVDLAPVSVLIVDDSHYARSFLRAGLAGFGITSVLEAEDCAAALAVLRAHPVHLVIVDRDLKPLNGIGFARMVRAGGDDERPDIVILMVATDGGRDCLVEARNAGVNEYLVKPVSNDSLQRRIRQALLNPKAFVRSPTYTGPDRRSLSRPPPGQPERRIRPPLPKPPPLIGPGAGLPPSLDGTPPGRAEPPQDEDGGLRHFEAGELIFQEGDGGDVAYVVEEGQVTIFKCHDGIEVELGRIGPQGVFGEMALIDGAPRMASARALAATRCLTIPKAVVRAQVGRTPDLVMLVLETLLHDIRKTGHELAEVRAAMERRRR